MYLKPSGCSGCPFEHLSKYYTPDKVVEGATVAIVGQAPGAHEEKGLLLLGKHYGQEVTQRVQPQPLIGASGSKLRKEFWLTTGLDFNKVSLHNVIKCRPFGSNELPSLANTKPVAGITTNQLKVAIAHCSRAHLTLPSSITHVLAMGEVALYYFSGEALLNYRKSFAELDEYGNEREKKSTVTEWRGWALKYDRATRTISQGLFDYFHPYQLRSTDLVIFPVIHIASLYENEKLYRATLVDFWKFGKLVKGSWPKPLPDIIINKVPSSVPAVVGFDTEYTAGGDLTMWSMADVDHHIYVVEAKHSTALLGLPNKLNLVTQNGRVDVPHLKPLLPKGYFEKVTIDDCMYAWAVVHPGEPCNLDYMLSVCGGYNRHKHLRTSADQYTRFMYAGLDAETTLNDVWRYLHKRLKADTLLEQEYLLRRRPLLRIVTRFEEIGVEVDRQRVEEVKVIMDAEIARINEEAAAVTGIPGFNIRSNGSEGQVAQFLYGVSAKVKPAKVKKPRKKKVSQQMELL